MTKLKTTNTINRSINITDDTSFMSWIKLRAQHLCC